MALIAKTSVRNRFLPAVSNRTSPQKAPECFEFPCKALGILSVKAGRAVAVSAELPGCSEALLEPPELLLPQISRIPWARWWGRNCSPRARWFSSAAPASGCGETGTGWEWKAPSWKHSPKTGQIQRIKPVLLQEPALRTCKMEHKGLGDHSS